MIRKIICSASILLLSSLWSFAEEKLPFVGKINADNVNVRAGQHINFERLMRLNKDREVIVVDKSYDWYKIKLPRDADCFVNEKYLTVRLEDVGIITNNHVNVRAAPSEKSSIIGQVNRGNLVKVKEHVPGWYKIKPVEGIYGWVKTEFVSYVSDRVPSPPILTELRPRKEVKQAIAEEKSKEKKSEEASLFSVVGRIEDVGRSVSSKTIHYKLVVDPKTIYYLEGDKALLDQSVHYTVRVQGMLKSDPEKRFKYPVVIVSTINSLL